MLFRSAFRDYPRAVEFRHRSWQENAPGTLARLHDAGAALVRIDEPFAPLPQVTASPSGTVPLAYFRFHGRNQAQWWTHGRSEDRYNYVYSEDEIAPFADAAREEAALEKRVLVYFNNHFSAKAVANADILKKQLGQIAPDWSLRQRGPAAARAAPSRTRTTR